MWFENKYIVVTSQGLGGVLIRSPLLGEKWISGG
jgi:hypothetical protein